MSNVKSSEECTWWFAGKKKFSLETATFVGKVKVWRPLHVAMLNIIIVSTTRELIGYVGHVL